MKVLSYFIEKIQIFFYRLLRPLLQGEFIEGRVFTGFASYTLVFDVFVSDKCQPSRTLETLKVVLPYSEGRHLYHSHVFAVESPRRTFLDYAQDHLARPLPFSVFLGILHELFSGDDDDFVFGKGSSSVVYTQIPLGEYGGHRPVFIFIVKNKNGGLLFETYENTGRKPPLKGSRFIFIQ